MLLPVLITTIIVLGAIVYYIYFLRPRFDPMKKADAFIQQNLLDDAIIEYRKVLDEQPNNFQIHYKIANCYLQKDEVDQAVRHLEEIDRIDQYNYEVDRVDVQRKLANAYYARGEFEQAFQKYINILSILPGDVEALYQVAFMALGQEFFDLAQKQFERLVLQNKNNFEVLFGAGITCYQNQKTSEAIKYLKEALVIDAHSDIANLAMAFAQQKKRDFKTAINYAKMVAENSNDSTAVFISKRLLGVLLVQARKPQEAVKKTEELLSYARKNGMQDEELVILYDLGFASISAEKTGQAYEYWNQAYKLDMGYKDIQKLITVLRKEMDANVQRQASGSESVMDYIDEWTEQAFPVNFIWNICGLKTNYNINLDNIIIAKNVGVTKEQNVSTERDRIDLSAEEKINIFNKIDTENFRIIANRVVSKLGYNVDQILPSYRESDGVDFEAYSRVTKQKTLVWVRRWKDLNIGEIPLRNFAQAINDAKAKEGLFITTSNITPAGEGALKRLSKVRMVFPEELADLLQGLV